MSTTMRGGLYAASCTRNVEVTSTTLRTSNGVSTFAPKPIASGISSSPLLEVHHSLHYRYRIKSSVDRQLRGIVGRVEKMSVRKTRLSSTSPVSLQPTSACPSLSTSRRQSQHNLACLGTAGLRRSWYRSTSIPRPWEERRMRVRGGRCAFSSTWTSGFRQGCA
jgi:hypothetical protein